jgi:hypothetical protein
MSLFTLNKSPNLHVTNRPFWFPIGCQEGRGFTSRCLFNRGCHLARMSNLSTGFLQSLRASHFEIGPEPEWPTVRSAAQSLGGSSHPKHSGQRRNGRAFVLLLSALPQDGLTGDCLAVASACLLSPDHADAVRAHPSRQRLRLQVSDGPLWSRLGFRLCGRLAARHFRSGLILGGIIGGVPMQDGVFSGGPFAFLSALGVVCGCGLVGGYALLGAGWLIWIDPDFRTGGRHAALILTFAMMVIVSAWTALADPQGHRSAPAAPTACRAAIDARLQVKWSLRSLAQRD